MAYVDTNQKTLPIGQSFFDRVIEDGAYYVDKTLFIKDILDRKAAVILCTRPRRFGKTLNQTMLKCFFEDTTPTTGKDTRALFSGLKIEAAGERYMEHQGKYPVIFMNFKEAGAQNFDEACMVFKDMLSAEFRRHKYVKEKIGDAVDLKKFENISSGEGDISLYRDSLRFLSKCLEDYHGQKTVILIDEYDVPLQKSWVCGYYEKMIEFIRPLLSSAFKDNPHLQFAAITGCLRISKESIFTGLNNLDVVSIFNKDYAEHFGFTQNEMDVLLKAYGLESKTQIVRDWYNGYLFGDTEIYNPWSSLKVVRSWITNINELPQPYWANTSSNDIIHDMIDNMNFKMKEGLEILMAGGNISAVVHEDVTYAEIYNDADNLWNFLFFTGYLKKVGNERLNGYGEITLDLSIPNVEVKYIYKTKIQEWFTRRVAKKNHETLFNAILNGDAETFQNELSKLLAESISFMDCAENFYHGFMTGILSGSNGYAVKSNREGGDGRSDLVMYSANGIDDKAVIFELKIAKEFDKLPIACEQALKQIEDKNYAAYWDKEGYKDIIKYGIGFYKKRCEVRKGM